MDQCLKYKKIQNINHFRSIRKLVNIKNLFEFFHWLHHVGPFSSSHCKYQVVNDKKYYFKEVGKYNKGTPQYSRKIGKSLSEYLILQGCSDFVLSIKIQNTFTFQVKRHTFHRATNFNSVLLLSTKHIFF